MAPRSCLAGAAEAERRDGVSVSSKSGAEPRRRGRERARSRRPAICLTQEPTSVEREAPIHVSNVMIVSPDDDKRTRIGSKLLADGRRARVDRRSGEVLDK